MNLVDRAIEGGQIMKTKTEKKAAKGLGLAHTAWLSINACRIYP